MSYRGAELRLDGACIRISTDDVHFSPEFDYGKNEDFLKYFVFAYVKLLSDSPLKDTHGEKPARLYWRFIKRLTTVKLADTIKTFSQYSHEILSNEYSSGSDSSTRVYHSFMKDTPVFKEYLQWLRTGQPELLKFILSFLLYGKKLEYEDPEFDATAFRGWLEVEDKLRTLVLIPDDIATLRNIIRVILPPLKVDFLLPKFGPGKVAERGVLDVYDKLGNLTLHPRLEYAFFRERPHKGRTLAEGFGRSHAVDVLKRCSRDSSRLKFVPKDITKSRSICMEPNVFMYFQQEVMRWMTMSIEDGIAGRFIDLQDQKKSRDAAIHGSLYLCTDTIDLSSASDSVSVELVKRIFPQDYLLYMLATRTSHVEKLGNQVTISVEKFAPMGSAVCFPTQCIIFTAVCIYAALAVHAGEPTGSRVFSCGTIRDFIANGFHSERSRSTPFTGRFEPPVVYGDDIAVDTRTTDSVISILTRLGFTVNRSKSFTGSMSFRESCGVYSFEGHDVTPVQFHIPFFKRGRWDAKVYASIIGALNWHGDNGYHGVATYLLNSLLDYGFNYPIPFVEDKDLFGVYTTRKRANRPEISRNRFGRQPYIVKMLTPYQTVEEMVQGIGPRRVRKEPEPESNLWFSREDYRKNQWWRSKVRDVTLLPDSKGSSLRIRPQETRLEGIWTPLE